MLIIFLCALGHLCFFFEESQLRSSADFWIGLFFVVVVDEFIELFVYFGH